MKRYMCSRSLKMIVVPVLIIRIEVGAMRSTSEETPGAPVTLDFGTVFFTMEI